MKEMDADFPLHQKWFALILAVRAIIPDPRYETREAQKGKSGRETYAHEREG